MRDLPDLVRAITGAKAREFDFASAPMPYYPDAALELDHRRVAVGDGRQKPEEYKGRAKFFAFCPQPPGQAASNPATCHHRGL
jgi:sn-glycerol 3-phosphate transport system substrate-binding protein